MDALYFTLCTVESQSAWRPSGNLLRRVSDGHDVVVKLNKSDMNRLKQESSLEAHGKL